MRVLPAEELHLPFRAGPHRMSMDLTTVPEAEWFEIDALYPLEMAEKRRLLGQQREAVFAAEPGSEAARGEALAVVTQALVAHHPTWFEQHNAVVRNHLTGETWNLGEASMDPLDLAGRLVQEDLCLIQMQDGQPVLTAASLCFPSRWRLSDKIGRPLGLVHAPVPLYADRLAGPVDRFMQHLKVGHIATRLNWSLLDEPALFQPSGKWRTGAQPDITATSAGERVFLRVERQSLRRLPMTGAVLFGIRVHVYPLHRLADQASTLAAAVRALPAEVAHYKSLLPFRTALLAWLDLRADGGRTATGSASS